MVLKATETGLGTCWVVSTYSKKNCEYELKYNGKLVSIIISAYPDTHVFPIQENQSMI
ncbi:nitroreductase family protein [Youngiibacter fragilis]|uniref:nitroreductase family protein n=1 Tax=Youngiibacter fragilis TaxID=1408819 RepID=UPI0009E90BB5